MREQLKQREPVESLESKGTVLPGAEEVTVLEKLEALYCIHLGFRMQQIVATGVEHFGFLQEHIRDTSFLFNHRCFWSVEA